MDDLWATKSEDVGIIDRAIVSKIFNLCGHDPPTSQTDGQTTCDSKTALCTVVHRAVKKTKNAVDCITAGLTSGVQPKGGGTWGLPPNSHKFLP